MFFPLVTFQFLFLKVYGSEVRIEAWNNLPPYPYTHYRLSIQSESPVTRQSTLHKNRSKILDKNICSIVKLSKI